MTKKLRKKYKESQRAGELEKYPTPVRLQITLKRKLLEYAGDDDRDLANYIRRVLWDHAEKRDLANG